MIAALYVKTNGVYFGLPDVEAYDVKRDARSYKGPFPVVAHPPCARWGKLWASQVGGRNQEFANDGGCFRHAVEIVREFGGVIEHPQYSNAFIYFGIKEPIAGGWIEADRYGGYTALVYQGNYGHRANKPTWLYTCKTALTPFVWTPSGMPSITSRLSKASRDATPVPFRDALLQLARSVSYTLP